MSFDNFSFSRIKSANERLVMLPEDCLLHETKSSNLFRP